MSHPVISVEGISKAFQIYKKPTDMMLEMLTGKQRHDLFWALRDISLEVNEHDRLGIIGANGSGKSTLLKIITGNLQPSSGRVSVRGNISAMLSLATSLNPEETGLSNIRFNLMLNGCPKNRISQVTEEIIEFTELGSFIYQPVKTYSSGMNAKLAFGIATAIEPDILIVDEVLSVGDGYFVSKAMKRMVNLCDRGRALLFVSHATSAVQMLCNKVIWMENGAIRLAGPTEHVLSLYEEDYRRREDELTRAGNKARVDEMEKYARAEDIVSGDVVRMRLVAAEGGPLHDTHYIRHLMCSDAASHAVIADVELINVFDHDHHQIGLDLYNSEWGRVYERHGYNCRMLAPRTGKSRGGHFTVPVLSACNAPALIQVELESQSLFGKERLAVEYLNYETGEWERGELLGEELLDDGWKKHCVNIRFAAVDPVRLLATQTRLIKRAMPQVEIVDIDLMAEGTSVRVVRERCSFAIVIKVRANRPTAIADVSVKITRSDGVYVYWQSSGMAGKNLQDILGDRSVTFDFNVNTLGAGVYHLNVAVANGWQYPENYPYSEVFDRRVGCLEFKILPELPALDMGLLNVLVPVRISGEGEN